MHEGFRWWAFWRRVQYGSGFLMVLALMSGGVYLGWLYEPASCFDGEQNGGESGVDCGGACVRICSAAVETPRVVWAKSFRITDGKYNAVAYLENRNEVAAAPEVRYTFRIYNGKEQIAEQQGRTFLPPASTYPIFEGPITLPPGIEPTLTTLEIEPIAVWVPAGGGRTQFRTTEIELTGADSQPRLRALVENTIVAPAAGVEIVATIFNAEGDPVTASKTFMDELPGLSRTPVYFTWPEPIAKTVRSCEVPSDIMVVLDRSGSMAADGGTPPEPLESAKRAAAAFVGLLQPRDTFGFVSYATTPTTPLEQTLTPDRGKVVAAIASTTMGRDGIQYTNMGDALRVAAAELTSSRHRSDARKVIVFLTDGDVTRPVNPQTGKLDRAYAAEHARTAAAEAKAADVTIYAIGFGDFLNSPNAQVSRDTELIKSLASGPETYFEAPTAADLAQVYQTIATDICEVGPARIEVIPKTKASFTNLNP
jgi:Mg-chelatase subunit ChlD